MLPLIPLFLFSKKKMFNYLIELKIRIGVYYFLLFIFFIILWVYYDRIKINL